MGFHCACDRKAARGSSPVMAGLAALLNLVIVLALATPASADVRREKRLLDDDSLADPGEVVECRYPPSRGKAAPAATTRAAFVFEDEPNDTVFSAQSINLDHGSPDIDIIGDLELFFAQDHFLVSLQEGDILGIAVLGDPFDPRVAIIGPSGSPVHVFIDDGSNIYPAASPLPRKQNPFDAMLSFIAPADGEYVIRVDGYDLSFGDYTMELRLRRSPFETAPGGAHQILFLDFDGATINAQALYGGANPAVLSPLADFLFDWSIPIWEESTLIDTILADVRQDFDAIASINPEFQYTLLNSRDHADPWGQPNVTRLIVGGRTSELGFPVIGIAESIDPGNFESEETGVVLLDNLSDLDPLNQNSVNNIPRTASFSKIEAVSRRVANTISHEAAHMLGCWHTEPSNNAYVIIDKGGVNIFRNRFETGPDGIMGTFDDDYVAFGPDDYADSEGVGESPSVEYVDVRLAYALTGSACREDLDGDGDVDGGDLAVLLADWGTPVAGSDLNGDGVVDGADLAALLAAWGACP